MTQRAFRCHICGGAYFRAVVVPRPDGSLYATSFYECAGCSVVFVDPNAFNANEPGPPQSQGARRPTSIPNPSRNTYGQPMAAPTRAATQSDAQSGSDDLMTSE
jgi:hypothetical protein